jgi:hypothetical protein
MLAGATAASRWSAAMKREVHPRDVALGQRNWPKRVQQISNAFNNQWESPTLFYAGVAFAMIAGEGGALLVALAWLYVASRVVHMLVYVTSNFIPLRFAVFLAGFTALIAFWVALAARVL